MELKKLIALTIIFSNLACLVCSQDIHFSQFGQTPLIINPALTGTFHGDRRALLNYKDQWRSIDAIPYQTMAFSYDWTMMKKKWENSYLGGGIAFFRDKAGDLSMGQTQINLSISSIISLNEYQHISAGLQGGIAQRSIDFSNANWESQFDGSGINTSLPSNESYTADPFLYPDFSMGVAWHYGTDESNIVANDMFRANGGISYLHLNKPKEVFYDSGEQLHSRMALHCSTFFGLRNSVGALLPSAILYIQGPQIESEYGLLFRYMLKEESRYTGIFKESALSLGGYFRTGDSVIPAALLELGNFAFGITYDINISNLKAATTARGGIELSLRYLSPNPFRTGKGTKSNVRFM